MRCYQFDSNGYESSDVIITARWCEGEMANKVLICLLVQTTARIHVIQITSLLIQSGQLGKDTACLYETSQFSPQLWQMLQKWAWWATSQKCMLQFTITQHNIHNIFDSKSRINRTDRVPLTMSMNHICVFFSYYSNLQMVTLYSMMFNTDNSVKISENVVLGFMTL